MGLVLIILSPVALLAGAGNPSCSTQATPPGTTTPVGSPAAGQFAAPLKLRPGRWYRIGATRYTGTVGSSGAFLPDYPDSFAELSLLDHNPYPAFTFSDADALGNLPYGTAVRVLYDGRSRVLIKRDIGYGQGPGQTIPYRMDIYQPAAQALGVSKDPVQVALAPPGGTGATLGQTPASPVTASGCTTGPPASLGTVPTTSSPRAVVLSDGDAAAPADAPVQVKQAIAAGNQIHTLPYPVPDVHYGPLASLWPAYDCSGAVSYLLYRIGALGTAESSGELTQWGQPGPGKWITVYASPGHTWIVIAGIAFDTSPEGQAAVGVPAGSGPRWRADPTGNLADGWAYVQRHPSGL